MVRYSPVMGGGGGGGGGGGALVSPLPTPRSTPEWSQEEIKEGGNI